MGWMPRFSMSCHSGVRAKNGSSSHNGIRQRTALLSAGGNAKDDDIGQQDDRSDQSGDHHGHEDLNSPPLFAEVEKQFHVDISRLEAMMYDVDLDLFNLEDISDGKSQRLLGGGRVILGDWMVGWEEGICLGDSCGDEFDVSRLFSSAAMTKCRGKLVCTHIASLLNQTSFFKQLAMRHPRRVQNRRP